MSNDSALPIMIPECIPPSKYSNEILAASCLILFKPFRNIAELKGNAADWNQSLTEYMDELRQGVGDSPASRDAILQMIEYRLQQPIANIVEKKSYLSNRNRDIVVIDWVNLLAVADPQLVENGRMKGWKNYLCWVCCLPPKENIKTCSKCGKARYCSVECQKSAWWHHKLCNDPNFGCLQVSKE